MLGAFAVGLSEALQSFNFQMKQHTDVSRGEIAKNPKQSSWDLEASTASFTGEQTFPGQEQVFSVKKPYYWSCFEHKEVKILLTLLFRLQQHCKQKKKGPLTTDKNQGSFGQRLLK